MATSTTVDSTSIAQAVNRIETGKSAVQGDAGRTIQEFATLSQSWTGEAGSGFQNVVNNQLQPIITEIVRKMQTLEDDVQQANGVYTKAGGAAEAGVQTLSVGLPGL